MQTFGTVFLIQLQEIISQLKKLKKQTAICFSQKSLSKILTINILQYFVINVKKITQKKE